MAFILNIPDEILESIKLPRNQVEKELQKEFAFLLYEKGFASMGVVRKLSGLTKWEFIEGLSQRNIGRHYDEKEYEEDLKYAKDKKWDNLQLFGRTQECLTVGFPWTRNREKRSKNGIEGGRCT